MNEFEIKKDGRIQRMRERVARLNAVAGAARARADGIASGIPAGQPILVGHHSERRHRRDIARMHDGMRKSIALTKEAEALAERADRAEASTAVSREDPEAVAKLREKLAAIEAKRDEGRRINKATRAKDPLAALMALGLSERLARAYLTPDFCGRIGVPDYELKNLGAEARRLAKRIAELCSNSD